MHIVEVEDPLGKKNITRTVLEALPDWFGIAAAREKYIQDSVDKIFFCAYCGKEPVGFLYLQQTGKDTVEIAVMGVLKQYHRCGIGKALFESAKKASIQNGYSFMQVKTVEMGKYEEYDKTNRFYIALGFKELEVFPTLWDEWNSCQISIRGIAPSFNERPGRWPLRISVGDCTPTEIRRWNPPPKEATAQWAGDISRELYHGVVTKRDGGGMLPKRTAYPLFLFLGIQLGRCKVNPCSPRQCQ